MNVAQVHRTAEVQTANVGHGTTIWQGVVVLGGESIGRDVDSCAHCFVENDAVIGDRVTVKSGVYLWDGVRLDDDVFVGPNVTFTNEKFPRPKQRQDKPPQTRFEAGASIGGGAGILPSSVIGRGAMGGAGAVVAGSVPPFAVVARSPARIMGYVENAGNAGRDKGVDIVASAADQGQAVHAVGVGGVTLRRLKYVPDTRGGRSIGEFERDIPFAPRRCFLGFDVPSEETRGEHAHRQCHQFLVCVKGCCAVVVDDGRARTEVQLDAPDLGTYLPPMTCGMQYKYSSDAVLLVFASHYYEAEDYIRDYAEFLTLVSGSGAR